MTRPRKAYVPPRCGDCRAPIRWLRFRGSWRPFTPAPVAADELHRGAAAYPVEGRVAHLVNELVEEFMGRRACSDNEARDEVYDLDWHAVHVCHHDDTPETQEPTP